MPALYLHDKHSSDASSSQHPRWVLFTGADSAPDYLQAGSDHQAAEIFHERFTPADIPRSSRITSLCAKVSLPTFVAANSSACVADSEKSFLSFLSFPERFPVEDWKSPDRDTLELISASVTELLSTPGLDPKDTTAQHPTAESKETMESAEELCQLSIRLMHGETAQAPFRATDSLKDVKRWLQKEKNLSMVPEDDEVISRYVHIGHCEPSRFAFFSPASRTTYTEAQELLRLKDLGLCPRSALILRPDFDVNAINAARAREKSMFKSLMSKVGPVLQAFYQFCHYDVDDAHRDLQDISDHTIREVVQPHIFPVSAAAALAVVEDEPSEEVHDYTFSTAGGESQGIMEES